MTTITVSNTAELYSALATATGGEVIKLATGNYGALKLTDASGFNVNFPPNVTITSENPLNPATLTGLELKNVSNLTVSNVVCDYQFKAGDPSYVTPFSVTGGSNVTISNCTFDGDVASGVSADANGYAYGTGLALTGTTNMHFSGNEMHNFYRGLSVSDSSNVNITGNEVTAIRSDGMDFIQVHGVTIAGNHIHDFRTNEASGDHPDMIQFWTAGTTAPSTDIVIRGNVLDSGSGSWTQSIFMGNELVSQGLAGTEMYYRNVTIADNVITNGQYHGITLGQTIGATITNNTVLHTDGNTPDGADSAVEIPVINVASESTGVTISQNVTAQVNGWSGQSGWVVSQNALVQDQDPNAAGYYGDVFISSSLTAHDGMHMFLALPGSVIDLLGAGAAATRNYLPLPGEVAALFQETVDHFGSVQTHFFDAGLSMTHTGSLPTGTVYTWTFGDGTQATGAKVTHTYASGGHYNVALTVTLPTGVSDSVVGTVGVQDRDLLTLGADGAFRVVEYENSIVVPGGNATGIHLGAAGVTATVADAFVSDITRANDFDILMRLKAGAKSSIGEVFRLNGGVMAKVDDAGKLQVQGYDRAGHMIQLNSGAISMTDLKPHSIDIKLHDGALQLWVDSKMTSSSVFTGTLASYGPTDMTFGNPWGAQNFRGDITAFAIKIGEKVATANRGALAQNVATTAASAAHLVQPANLAPAEVQPGHAWAPADATAAVAGVAISKTLDLPSTIHAAGTFSSAHKSAVPDLGQMRHAAGPENSLPAVEFHQDSPRAASSGIALTGQSEDCLDFRTKGGGLHNLSNATIASHSGSDGTQTASDQGHSTFDGLASSIGQFSHGEAYAFDLVPVFENAWAP